MARILITGSSDGIGLHAAQTLISRGHAVVLHARSAERAAETKKAAPGAEDVLIADISTISGMKQLTVEANKKSSMYDCVIHNAGIGYQQPFQKTKDGFATVFAVNSLAPYVLTASMRPPKRLIYVSSGLHSGGDGSLEDVTWTSGRSWRGLQAYSDSKLHNVILANAVARRWKSVESNAIEPGWVATKMGGRSAPGTVEAGADTISWLASDGKHRTGQLFKDRRAIRPHASAADEQTQDELLKIYEKVSGVSFPDA